MSQRRRLRQLRKKILVLQAQHYRAALQQDLSSLSAPWDGVANGQAGAKWLAIGTLLSLLPNRWGRLLNLGLLSWRLIKRLLAEKYDPPID